MPLVVSSLYEPTTTVSPSMATDCPNSSPSLPSDGCKVAVSRQSPAVSLVNTNAEPAATPGAPTTAVSPSIATDCPILSSSTPLKSDSLLSVVCHIS